MPTVASAALALSPSVSAAEWTLTPRVELREAYTDNLTLAPRGSERSSFITEVSPGISLRGKGPDLTANLGYLMQNLYYSNNDNKLNTNHLLGSNLRSKVAGDLFFDGKASITQQNVSPFRPRAVDSLSVNENRTEVRSYSVSPYLSHRFGDAATAELRYTHDAVRTKGNNLLDSDGNRVYFNVDSGPAYETLGWRANAEKQVIDDDRRGRAELQRASVSGRYRFSRRWTWFANVGREKYDYFSTSDDPNGSFWMTGFAWNPSDSTGMSAKVGHRFYGRAYALNVMHRTGFVTFRASYDEEVASTRAQFLLPAAIDTAGFLDQAWEASIPDPEARRQAIERFIRNTGTPESLAEPLSTFSTNLYLEKKAQASVAFIGQRSTTILSAFHARRDPDAGRNTGIPGSGVASLDDNVRQAGTNVRWLYRVAERTTLLATAEYVRIRSETTDRVDAHKLARVALMRTLRPNVDGSVEIRRNLQTSNRAASDMRENAIVATVRIEF